MAAPEDRPEIAKLKDDITIPTALVQLVRLAPLVVLFVGAAAPLARLLRLPPCVRGDILLCGLDVALKSAESRANRRL